MNIELLEELYINQKLSQREVADQLGCSQTTVRYYLGKHNLKRNTRNIETNTESKRCPHCKEVKPRTEYYMISRNGHTKSGSWCKKCMNTQVVVRQRKYKQQAVDMKGGACQSCGFNQYFGALDFHHVDPTQKDGQINRMSMSPTNDRVQAELAKCVLLCANCHRMVHAQIIDCPSIN